MNTTELTCHTSIDFYRGGYAIKAPSDNAKSGGGGRRGKVAGWSRASRRRMRDYMLTHAPAVDSYEVGATFTIPGPVMELPRTKRLWKDWADSCRKRGWAAIWRMEVQKRGALHWHCIVVVPVGSIDGGSDVERVIAPLVVKQSWEKILRSTGEETFDPPFVSKNGKLEYTTVQSRMGLCGSEKIGARCEVDESNGGAWRRYLQDHASKSKQEQIAEGMGRHWGKINKNMFVEQAPSLTVELSRKEAAKVVRALQRLCTPVLAVKGSKSRFRVVEGVTCKYKVRAEPFKARLGRRVRFGTFGRAVRFGRVDTVQRLTDWVVQSRAASELHPLSRHHAFWENEPLMEKIRAVIDIQKADPVKALPPASQLTRAIVPMLPPRDNDFILQIRPEWISKLIRT